MIVDYLLCTQVNPILILQHFIMNVFNKKVVVKILNNLIQIISNELSNGVENVVMLKCAD